MPRSLCLDNIGELTTHDFEGSGRRSNAAVVIVDDRIAWVGDAGSAPSCDDRIDARGRAVLPGWVDSHTHLVFGGDRTSEFESRMAGQDYVAGGIEVTVDATRRATDTELSRRLERMVHEARSGGTTTIETKTGYGLDIEHEVRSARIARGQVDAVTFLGAHVVPRDSDRETYLDLVCGPMLDEVAPFVSAVDVFCEEGAFDREESDRVLRAARRAGLATRVHGNQLSYGPGVQLAVEHRALSVDHLGFLTGGDIDALADSWHWGVRGTVATVLPACDLSTRMPLAPARSLVDAGVVLAIASNCNPGTSYTSSMAFCVATAVLQMSLSVAEAVRAATLGGAIALAIDEDGWKGPDGTPQPAVGRITPGARADLQILDAPSVTHLAYRPGMPLTSAVWKNGERVR